MENEKNAELSMQIILHAGDARVACMEAYQAIADADFEQAQVKLKDARKKITLAHQLQTDAIQGETRGEKSEYSLLFAHAQDTLMTINSEILMARQMLKIARNYEKRIADLEAKLG